MSEKASLLRLPRELRDVVWEMVLMNSNCTGRFFAGWFADNMMQTPSAGVGSSPRLKSKAHAIVLSLPRHPLNTGDSRQDYWGTERMTRLLRVNKQISVEATEVMYRDFTFIVPYIQKVESISSIQRLHPATRARIRRLYVPENATIAFPQWTFVPTINGFPSVPKVQQRLEYLIDMLPGLTFLGCSLDLLGSSYLTITDQSISEHAERALFPLVRVPEFRVLLRVFDSSEYFFNDHAKLHHRLCENITQAVSDSIENLRKSNSNPPKALKRPQNPRPKLLTLPSAIRQRIWWLVLQNDTPKKIHVYKKDGTTQATSQNWEPIPTFHYKLPPEALALSRVHEQLKHELRSLVHSRYLFVAPEDYKCYKSPLDYLDDFDRVLLRDVQVQTVILLKPTKNPEASEQIQDFCKRIRIWRKCLPVACRLTAVVSFSLLLTDQDAWKERSLLPGEDIEADVWDHRNRHLVISRLMEQLEHMRGEFWKHPPVKGCEFRTEFREEQYTNFAPEVNAVIKSPGWVPNAG